MTYTNIKSLEIMHMLLDSQIYAPAIRPPSVPINQARIRFSLHANLSLKDLDLLIEALCK
ncbi:pyridoxal phosphate-dependent aminotransferase family protein, partial [Campylobacter lari]